MKLLEKLLKSLILIIFTKLYSIEAVVAMKMVDVTGTITYVCAVYRPRDLTLDDIEMAEILTLCTCIKLGSWHVITVKECYAQKDWFVSIVVTTFKAKLWPINNTRRITGIVESKGFTLLQLDDELGTGSSLTYADRPLRQDTICHLYSFSTPDKYPVTRKNISKNDLWYMQGGVYEVEVRALFWKNCRFLFNNIALPNRPILNTTLCLLPIEGEEFEPCSFDIGAPIVCHGKLQGILLDPKLLKQGIPDEVQSECYRNLTLLLPFFAESFDKSYSRWVKYVMFGKTDLTVPRNKVSRVVFNVFMLITCVIPNY